MVFLFPHLFHSTHENCSTISESMHSFNINITNAEMNYNDDLEIHVRTNEFKIIIYIHQENVVPHRGRCCMKKKEIVGFFFKKCSPPPHYYIHH